MEQTAARAGFVADASKGCGSEAWFQRVAYRGTGTAFPDESKSRSCISFAIPPILLKGGGSQHSRRHNQAPALGIDLQQPVKLPDPCRQAWPPLDFLHVSELGHPAPRKHHSRRKVDFFADRLYPEPLG